MGNMGVKKEGVFAEVLYPAHNGLRQSGVKPENAMQFPLKKALQRACSEIQEKLGFIYCSTPLK
jgi:hypothetical protein